MTLRSLARAALLLLAVALALVPAAAQRLSDRTIFIVVPFTPGTGIDVLARLVGEELRQRWNQPVVIENKPGASGNIGTQAASRAEPDGHTIMMTVNTFVMNASLFKSLPYDPVRSFEPIVEVATGAVALAVHPSVPAKSVKELVAAAKASPGTIDYASPGRGTPQHLAMELFKLTAGVDLKHVPYTGSAGAVKDLVGGHVKAMFIPVHTVLPLAQDGQVRVLAIGSDRRSPMAPNVPTLAEEGVAGFDVDLWYGLLAPAGTPKEIVQRYNAVVNEILATPRVKEALEKQGLVAVGGPPERLGDLVRKDLDRWAKVVKDAGIAAE
ncbi:MAG TPA: tripartite tricarboxylate transporter substrate binding protein [Beijerinckiaceae bacterium]|jgi:tripartite-type tricarboxylate transporter receptor subunit TctC